VCAGADKIFHWETGTTLRNSSGDNRLVNFYEQWPWNMALLELFVGGQATFSTFAREGQQLRRLQVGDDTVTVIESQFGGPQPRYLALVAGVASTRQGRWTTKVTLQTDAFESSSSSSSRVEVHQWRMNASYSVVETIVRELSDNKTHPGTLLHADGLPYDFGRLLTARGMAYAEAPENLERYWAMHAGTFRPGPFEGTWRRRRAAGRGEQEGRGGGTTEFQLEVAASSVTVVSARLVHRWEE
jgi:hypothetical protein